MFTSGGLGLSLGLKNLVLFTSLALIYKVEGLYVHVFVIERVSELSEVVCFYCQTSHPYCLLPHVIDHLNRHDPGSR